MLRNHAWALVTLAVLLAAAPAAAQTTTGTIEGRVLDQSGDPLPGATVALVVSAA